MDRKNAFNQDFIPNIWLSDTRLNKAWRFKNFSDKGGLTLSQEEILFSGQRGLLKIKDIVEIDLIYANFPWGNLLIGFCFLLVYILGGLYINPSQPRTTFFEAFFIYLIIVIAIESILEKTRLWIKLTYKTEGQNTHQTLYLSDGSRLGELQGGTLRLYKKFQKLYSQQAG